MPLPHPSVSLLRCSSRDFSPSAGPFSFPSLLFLFRSQLSFRQHRPFLSRLCRFECTLRRFVPCLALRRICARLSARTHPRRERIRNTVPITRYRPAAPLRLLLASSANPPPSVPPSIHPSDVVSLPLFSSFGRPSSLVLSPLVYALACDQPCDCRH